MADNVQECINQIHDLTLEKSHVINDKNYRRYLPRKHKILRSLYQAWIFLVVVSVLLGIGYFLTTETWIRALAYNGLIAILLYSLFILVMSLGLYAAAYTVPIAVTNEVKAKRVMRINKRLDVLKESLQRAFQNAIITDGLHKGKFGLKDIHRSVVDFIQTGFPNVQYIKEIVTDEIIKPVEQRVADYVAEMGNVLLGKLKDSAVKIQVVAENAGTKPEFVVLIPWNTDAPIYYFPWATIGDGYYTATLSAAGVSDAGAGSSGAAGVSDADAFGSAAAPAPLRPIRATSARAKENSNTLRSLFIVGPLFCMPVRIGRRL